MKRLLFLFYRSEYLQVMNKNVFLVPVCVCVCSFLIVLGCLILAVLTTFKEHEKLSAHWLVVLVGLLICVSHRMICFKPDKNISPWSGSEIFSFFFYLCSGNLRHLHLRGRVWSEDLGRRMSLSLQRLEGEAAVRPQAALRPR